MTIDRYNETRDEDELSYDDMLALCDDSTGLADDIFPTRAEAFATGVVWAERPASRTYNEQLIRLSRGETR